VHKYFKISLARSRIMISLLRSIAKPEHLADILCLDNTTYSFVKHDHAVVAYLARNPTLLTCNIREQPLIDGTHYKIDNASVIYVLKMMAKYDVVHLQRFIRGMWLPSLEPKRQDKRTAVAMCLHARLGKNSALASLDQDLISQIISHLSDVSDERIRRGKLIPLPKPKPTAQPATPRYLTGDALVWTDLSKVDLNALNRRSVVVAGLQT